MSKIILEGIDASGKSTLANTLIQKGTYDKVLHIGKNEIIDKNSFFNLLKLKLETIILDRFHLSELIFPILYSRASKISYNDYKKINEFIIKNKIIYIVFTCSNMNIINERLKERGEFNYIKEVPLQNDLFTLFANQFKTMYNYKYFYNIDIAEENAYDKLDTWLNNILQETSL